MTFPVLSANGPSGYNLTRSLRTRSSASAYLNRTPASASNRTTWTWSAWVKRGIFNEQYADREVLFGAYNAFNDTEWLEFGFGQNSDGYNTIYGTTNNYGTSTTQVFRDPSSWYHIVIALDTTQASASNRIFVYVNGVKTSFSGSSWGSVATQNVQLAVNGLWLHNISKSPAYSSRYFDGYMAEVNFIDGQALTPSSFGSTNSTTGVWQPAAYTGTYGTNGFYLPFTDNSALTTASNAGLGKDFSGNANYWVTNNISITAGATYDSMTDVPTLTSATAANYPVANPLWKEATTTITNGNLNVTGGNQGGFSTMAMPTGSKFYCEATVTIVEGYQGVGIVKASAFSGSLSSASLFGTSAYSYYAPSGNKYVLNTSSAYGSSWGTVNDVIGIAADLSANTLTFYKNNVSQGAITIDGGIDYHFGVSNAGVDGAVAFNYGQQPFAYTPPTGFIRLNTYNIAASTVPNGAAYMAATLYTGNGTTTGNTQTIANTVGSASFQPDLVWIKSRSAATWNILTDSVRGANKTIYSNSTFYEESLSNVMNSFNSNGFTAAYNSSYAQVVANANSETYVGWQWKAGGTGVSNTNGTITSTVSANTTSGCSVVKYISNGTNGATVGHGLGVAPSLVIVKCTYTGTSQAWAVYHASLGATQYLTLQSTDAATTSSAYWNNTAPSSSVFTIGTSNDVNINSSVYTYAAYCFAAIKGFSAFGSYTGNGSTDGPFVYLGFRPRYLMLKVSSTAGYDWLVYDSSRDPYNVTQYNLRADTSDAESTQTANYLDFLSNGFKIRGSSAGSINPSQTVIYAAFAENPFQNSLAR